MRTKDEIIERLKRLGEKKRLLLKVIKEIDDEEYELNDKLWKLWEE